MSVRQERCLLLFMFIVKNVCYEYMNISASKTVERCSFHHPTFVEVQPAAFSVLISVNCQTLQFSNLLVAFPLEFQRRDLQSALTSSLENFGLLSNFSIKRLICSACFSSNSVCLLRNASSTSDELAHFIV